MVLEKFDLFAVICCYYIYFLSAGNRRKLDRTPDVHENNLGLLIIKTIAVGITDSHNVRVQKHDAQLTQ